MTPTAPAITSADNAVFTAGTVGAFTVNATGSPTPAITRTGALPSGVTFTDNHDGTATVTGSAAPGTGGSYPLTWTAGNGVGTNATQTFSLTVHENPAVTSPTGATFTVGVAGSLTVTATGSPLPTVGATGTLPSGVSFNSITRQLGGVPAQGTTGSYPIVFNATNGVGGGTSQNFTLTVDQAAMTYPTVGQTNVDSTLPFTWSTIPEAQGYILQVGTTQYGNNLVNSGILPATQSSFAVPSLASGPILYATLYTEVNGAWSSFQAISFTAAPGQAALTFPLNGQTGVDPTRPFTWSTVPNAQGYILIVGTALYGTNLVNSGALAAGQSSFATPILPTGVTLYATVFTKVNGVFSRIQSIVFTAGPAMGTFTHPVQAQLNVAAPTAFTWQTIAGAQNYILVVGTTLYGSNLANSGILPPSQSSFTVPALPKGKVLYATLLTKVNGIWVFQVIGFGT